MSRFRHSQQGINLIELLIVICILALSLSVGVPGYQDLRTSQDRSAALIELVSAARLARSEAAMRRTLVRVCASTDGTSCSGANDWSRGWLVFEDLDDDKTVDDDAEMVFKTVRFENRRFTISGGDAIGSGITFDAFGFPQPSSGVFTYEDRFEQRDIELSYVGRLMVTDPGGDEES